MIRVVLAVAAILAYVIFCAAFVSPRWTPPPPVVHIYVSAGTDA